MQEKRTIAVETPLGKDALLLSRMAGTEQLGSLFEYRLDLLSEDPDIAFEDLLGQAMTVRMALSEEVSRYFNGVVTGFDYTGMSGKFHSYTATLRPWLWFLTRTADCRIFPDVNAGHPEQMTVPEIIMELFKEFGFSDVKDSLSGEYPKREHCVQYRESAFDFVSRLMEDEGIYYYFEHENGKHTLVLADGYSSHEQVKGYEEVPYYPPTENVTRETDNISEWTISKSIQTGQFSLTDYDFERPKSSLAVSSAAPAEQAESKYEAYDYPGGYLETSPDGDHYARARLEAHASRYERVAGAGNVRGFGAGALFKLAEFPRDDQNREYLLVQVVHELQGEDFESSAKGAGATYHGRFEAAPAQQPYRSLRTTPGAKIEGPQTATVVGKKGEKVWTDNYGRIKVQFHWDRSGKQDEKSSCWVRVSQNWAGKGWGGMFLPHLGQEVIVEFLEGNPDQPIVTGRVYNADNMPHLALPENKLKSIIRDDFGNEMIFDASPGDEHIRLHSPHHRSSIELGRSIKYKTASDRHNLTIGNTYNMEYGHNAIFQIGTKASAFLGGKADFFLGGSLSLWLGASVDLAAGVKMGFFWGGKYEYTRGFKMSNTTGREIKSVESQLVMRSNDDVTVDSEKDCRIVGGDHDNAIIKAGKTSIKLQYGSNSAKNATPAQASAKRKMVGAMIAGVTAAAGATVAAASAFSQICENEGGVMDDVHPLADLDGATMWTTVGVAGASSLAATVAAALAGRSANKKEEAKNPDATQDKTFSEIKMDKAGVFLVKRDGGGSAIKAQLTLLSDGTVRIEGKGAMSIKSAVSIELDAPEITIKQNQIATANKKFTVG